MTQLKNTLWKGKRQRLFSTFGFGRLFSTFGFGCAPETYTAEVKRHYFMSRLSTRGIFESLSPRFAPTEA